MEENDPDLTLLADDSFKVGQVLEVLQLKLAKREVDISALEKGGIKVSR